MAIRTYVCPLSSRDCILITQTIKFQDVTLIRQPDEIIVKSGYLGQLGLLCVQQGR